jgi:hypothetical protein
MARQALAAISLLSNRLAGQYQNTAGTNMAGA